MEDSQVSGSISARRKKLVTERTKELRKLLSSPSHSQNGIAPASFAELLFSRAPVEFLEEATPQVLADRTTQVLRVFETHLRTPNQVIIEELTARVEGRISLAIALGDRPFIVNTILSTLGSFDIYPEVFLHPIVNHGGTQISCSYLEIEVVDARLADQLREALLTSLTLLHLVTDDFSAMTTTASALAASVGKTLKETAGSSSEVGQFLRWLVDGGFIFLAYACHPVTAKKSVTSPTTTLGVLRGTGTIPEGISADILEDIQRLAASPRTVDVCKSRTKSPVHRNHRPLHIAIAEMDGAGSLTSVHSFVGLLTSKAIAEESSSIPLIRIKIREVIDRLDILPNSHDFKRISNLFDSMPKEELLERDIEALMSDVQEILTIQKTNETIASVRRDASKRGVSVLVVMPQYRFTNEVRERLEDHLVQSLRVPTNSVSHHVGIYGTTLARIHFSLLLPDAKTSVDKEGLQDELIELCKSWDDQLAQRLVDSGVFSSLEGASKYAGAFPDSYTALIAPEEAERDVSVIEGLSAEEPINLRLASAPGEVTDSFTIVLYNAGTHVELSRAVPTLENVGLFVIREDSIPVTLSTQLVDGGASPSVVYLHRFLVRSSRGVLVTKDAFESHIRPGLISIFGDATENDVLNSLLVSATLDIKAISVLRAYSALLWQVNKTVTRRGILEAFASQPKVSALLWKLISQKFNHATRISIEKRRAAADAIISEIRDALRSVSSVSVDRVLRNVATLITHTLRANFFTSEETFAFKLQSDAIDFLPNPKPKYEIFVYGRHVEGVHLRTGSVARGGLRWSERPEDYRTEILGLVKTQKIKNTLIVPTGAKGGFLLKREVSPEEKTAAVVDAYKVFIRSLLSITDNRVGDKIIAPKDLVIYDPEDPYFVVAADKGTATFSDIANEIAVKEFDFWLGDGFASGGSVGYSHKDYGVTARGVWECVKRHCNDIGLDHLTTPFSVVGIGDMSGDVFGNGLLLSPRMKLVAAFDHRHIFLDPNPDPSASHEERSRLFALPRSSWMDYRKELISKGGGVYPRTEKEIPLSNEVRKALALPEDLPSTVDGDTLMTHILRAPVDLLWNGGIGTYVKSSSESHADANDSANDAIRINGSEVRARIIGEGGNLGFTQRGRIELARHAKNLQRIITDAIDNSAGVDLSDHEVNLKILFAELMRRKALSREDRDVLLKEIAHDVVADVLTHNASQSLVVGLAAEASLTTIDEIKLLLRETARLGYISRSLEALPYDAELDERALRKDPLTRPELAVCLAVLKMWMKDVAITDGIVRDPNLEHYLISYFPEKVRSKFVEDIRRHPIRDHIIATQMVNDVVDAGGLTLLPRLIQSGTLTASRALLSIVAAEGILETGGTRASLRTIDTVKGNAAFLESYRLVQVSVGRAAAWLAQRHESANALADIITPYRDAMRALVEHPESLLDENEKTSFDAHVTQLKLIGLDSTTAHRVALAPYTIRTLEALYTAQKASTDFTVAIESYGAISKHLGVSEILSLEGKFDGATGAERELLADSFLTIRRAVSSLTIAALAKKKSSPASAMEFVQSAPGIDRASRVIREASGRIPSIADLAIVAKHLREVTPKNA